jgi:hypothetical protein
MKAKKSKGKPAAKRATKDLPPKKAGEVKGGFFINPAIATSIANIQHEAAKQIVQNIRG